MTIALVTTRRLLTQRTVCHSLLAIGLPNHLLSRIEKWPQPTLIARSSALRYDHEQRGVSRPGPVTTGCHFVGAARTIRWSGSHYLSATTLCERAVDRTRAIPRRFAIAAGPNSALA